MAGKTGSVLQVVEDQNIDDVQFNGLTAEVGGSPLLGHSPTTGKREDDFEIGDESVTVDNPNGSLLETQKVRSGGNLKIYNASGVLVTTIPWAQLGSGGAGAGLETIALKMGMEKAGYYYPMPNQQYLSNSFMSTDNLQVWPRQIYDASVDLTTMYLDHGSNNELETINDMETVGDFTAGTNTPTVAVDTTNFLEGTQSVKFTTSTTVGDHDMYEAVTLSITERNFRVSVRPDTLTNVTQAYVIFWIDASNYRRFNFAVADLTVSVFNHLTCDFDDTTAYSDTGTFVQSNINRIYYGITSGSGQVMVPSWDLARCISREPLLVPGYTLDLPIQDTTNQEIAHIVSEDLTDNTTKCKVCLLYTSPSPRD